MYKRKQLYRVYDQTRDHTTKISTAQRYNEVEGTLLIREFISWKKTK